MMSLQQVGSSDSSPQLGCHVPSQLQTVSAGAHLSAPLQFFSPSAISWRGCSQPALLHCCELLCSSACIMSAQLHFVSSASIYLLWRVLSSAVTDQLQDISSAMKCKILYNLSSQLQFVFSVMICQLGSSLSAQSVSLAAMSAC